MTYNLRTDVSWSEMYARYAADFAALAKLGALAWRQAAIEAQTSDAMASNLQCNSWSISGICAHLDSVGIRPDLTTMHWGLSQEGAGPPVSFFVKV